MAELTGSIDWEKLREIFPDLPNECTDVTIRIKIDSLVEISATFYPEVSEKLLTTEK